MAHLIDKDALVAGIERRRRDWRYGSSIEAKFKREECDDILSFLDTIEVKEVHLEKEVHSQMDLLCNLLCYMDELSNGDSEGVYPLPINVNEDLQRFAKYFFELGLSVSNESQKGE